MQVLAGVVAIMTQQFLYTTHSSRNPLLQALVGQGVEVRHVTFGKALADLPACLGFYGNLFDEIKQWRRLAALKGQLRAHNVPYVFWNRDAPWNTGMKFKNRLVLQWLKPLDIYLAHSMQKQQWFGCNSHYFPNAAQPAYYEDTDLQALRNESTYKYDVSFFGSVGNAKDAAARARQQFLETLERLLKAAIPAIRFKVIDTAHQPLSLSEQLALIRTTKINLNYGAMCDLPGNPSWGLPERVFGIPAAGGYVLTDHRQSIAQTFPRIECDSFSTLEQCAQQIDIMLNDFATLRTQAEQLHQEVLATHTYSHRAQTLMMLLQNYRNKDAA